MACSPLKIELVHLNHNSVLHIVVFVHLYEAYLTISPNFALFKYYFFSKYQPSVANCQVIGGVSNQAQTNLDFLAFPLKTSLNDWHTQWFYCHKLNLPPFVGQLPEYDRSWLEEPSDAKMPTVLALAG
jgi:hypothetical protein